mgnify:FL=1
MEMPKRVRKTEAEAPLIDPTKAKQLISHGRMTESKVAGKQVCLKISPELLRRCDEASVEASISRSSYIKMAILEKLERDGK